MARTVAALTMDAGGRRGHAIVQQDELLLLSQHISQGSTREVTQWGMSKERCTGRSWLLQLWELLREKAQDSVSCGNTVQEGKLLSVGGVPSGGSRSAMFWSFDQISPIQITWVSPSAFMN